MRAVIVAYADTCHTSLMGFVEAAYYWRYRKPIPRGALDKDLTDLLCAEEGALPSYLIEFLFNGRERWKIVHQTECRVCPIGRS